MSSRPITSWQIKQGKSESSERLYFGGLPLWMMTATLKLKDARSLEEKLRQTDSMLKVETLLCPKKFI